MQSIQYTKKIPLVIDRTPEVIDDETKQEDDTKQEEETEQEEELIDPVGQEPLEDTSKDCNCTVIVEDESYDPEYFSSVWLSPQSLGYWNETGVFMGRVAGTVRNT